MNILSIIPFAEKLIDKFFPDPQEKAAAKFKLLEMEQAGEFKDIDAQLKRDLEQIALNKIEAGSDNLFKSGWRPAVGWTCAAGFIYAVIIYPILTWVAVIFDIVPPPNVNTEILITVLFGLLGLGGMRSFEKWKGLTR